MVGITSYDGNETRDNNQADTEDAMGTDRNGQTNNGGKPETTGVNWETNPRRQGGSPTAKNYVAIYA